MQKLVGLITALVFVAACGGNTGGGERQGRHMPGDDPDPAGPTPTATPFGSALHISPGHVESSAAGMAMKASIGNTHHVTSAAGVSATIFVGQPSASQ